MKLVYFGLCFFLFFPAFSQKEVRTYYDAQKNHIQEDYFVSLQDNSIINGKYKRYYENGNLMIDGNFDDGNKSGLFTEFHENGKISRKISYVNGLRHGAVQVFNEDGESLQKAYY